MRLFVLLLVVLSACAGPAIQEPPVTEAESEISTTTSVAEGSTTTGAYTTIESAPESTTTTSSDRQVAPDFTLELGDGGTYTLSDGEKPVYLVFWAEWCPTCRRELPVVDAVAADYGDRIDFVAPAWKSDFERTRARAVGTFVSGNVMWGLDEDEDIFEKYGVPYQPVTVLIAADRTVVTAWAGRKAEEEIRAELDALLELSG